MQNNPYEAYAAHAPARFPAEIKPGVFNIWGISGYTGSISTEESLNSEQTYCNLAKIQQSMTGHNQFDPFKFSKPDAETKIETKDDVVDSASNSDSNSDNDSDHESETLSVSKPKTYNYADYSTYKFGIVPPPYPPKESSKKHHKKPKEKVKKEPDGDSKCKSCAGVSGFQVKKIKKLGGEPWCWACVWGRYNHKAQQVWEESEGVKIDD